MLHNGKIRIGVYIILILLAVLSVVQGGKNALYYSQDLQYDAALALRCGIDPYEESLNPTGALDEGETAAYYESFREKGIPQKMEANQFPSLLMLLFPLTLFPFETAKTLWLILNLVFAALSALLLKKTFFKETKDDLFYVLMLITLAGTPFRNQIGVGQHTVFSFFFLLLAVYLSEKNLVIPSAAALSISYFKYTLTAPLAMYFIYKKRYREFFLSLVPHILGTFIGAKMLGTGVVDMIVKPLKVSSALSGEGSIDVGALLSGGGSAVVITAIIMLFCFALSCLLPEGFDRELFSLLLLLSLIMTYHRIYDFFVLSAAGCAITGCLGDLDKEKLFKTPGGGIAVFFSLLILYFYFLLRIFPEEGIFLKAGAFLYYLYIVVFGIFFFRRRSDAG